MNVRLVFVNIVISKRARKAIKNIGVVNMPRKKVIGGLLKYNYDNDTNKKNNTVGSYYMAQW
jgi:hypothetical protein